MNPKEEIWIRAYIASLESVLTYVFEAPISGDDAVRKADMASKRFADRAAQSTQGTAK